ncbi:MAG: ATP-binding cassette domain-containing protein [Cytophagales bacterium]|nr:ATP-binding cassette domain-containing protein [Cytophagales bacterium]
MSRPVIRVENLSKLYQLGEMGTGQISSDVAVWLRRLRGKNSGELPTEPKESKKSDYWALRNINFDVQQGEVLGIIGKNGAGKSTLLKILSRITSPTTGTIKVKGRIASLLEVGTGFHPELSGRDNVYLNGSFLGMKKWEIDQRFDEIVDFSGIEKFIDTPVKRYSSGMYVRLAFAVAAHLEPEILIIDEVLAVGDAEFQKKCMGKMDDVSKKEGRTVLFVSHDIGSISKLCTKGLYLKDGEIVLNAQIQSVVNAYLFSDVKQNLEYTSSKQNNTIESISLIYENSRQKTVKFYATDHVVLRISCHMPEAGLCVGVAFKNSRGDKLFTTIKEVDRMGAATVYLKLPRVFLSSDYFIDCAVFRLNGFIFEYISEALGFSIIDVSSELTGYESANVGSLNIECEWLSDF